MTELKEFKLPDVGEGLTEADIVAWHVKPGDRVEVNQIIVEIETAKAVVELPSPWDGTVAQLLAEEGQTVDVGVPIIVVNTSDTERAFSSPPAQPARPAPEPAASLTRTAASVVMRLVPLRLSRPRRCRDAASVRSSTRVEAVRPRG